jgi:hypothetical protein
VNVLHVEVDTLTSPPNWQTIADDIQTWLGATYGGMIPTNYTWNQLVVTDENYPGSTHGQGVHVTTQQGGRPFGDNKVDPAMCAVGTFKTAVAKRYARGHIFFPPVLDSAQLGGSYTFATAGTYWTGINAFLNAFEAGHTAGSTSYVPEVFSPTEVREAKTPFSFPIVGASITNKQHFLRSRSTIP